MVTLTYINPNYKDLTPKIYTLSAVRELIPNNTARNDPFYESIYPCLRFSKYGYINSRMILNPRNG